MSTVQALTELSHRADEVAAFCRETGEPIQVTHLAGDDLVLMSVEAYRRQRELAVSEARRQAAEEARRPLLEAARRLQLCRPPAAERGAPPPPRRDRLYTFRSRPYIFRHFGLAASKKRKAASPNIS